MARTLEWVDSAGGSSRPRDRTRIPDVSCMARWILYHWCHLGKPLQRMRHPSFTAWQSSMGRVSTSFPCGQARRYHLESVPTLVSLWGMGPPGTPSMGNLTSNTDQLLMVLGAGSSKSGWLNFAPRCLLGWLLAASSRVLDSRKLF